MEHQSHHSRQSLATSTFCYLPYEKLQIDWSPHHKSFQLSLPWLKMDIDVDFGERDWIWQATQHLHDDSECSDVQRFIKNLKDYPLFYIKPRALDQFDSRQRQACLPLGLDTSTPARLFKGLDLNLNEEVPLNVDQEPDLINNIPVQWMWDWDKILSKALIDGTDLYDPVSLVTYLICYRLDYESTSWSGQDGLGQLLQSYLQQDEALFFKAIGFITKQSWYVTMTSSHAMKPALHTFSAAHDLIHHFINDEAGHYKFMEQVFADLNLDKDDFNVAPATKWLLACHNCVATISPLAFAAMINLFEAAFYEGQDPISRVIEQSSKPQASRGYNLHYKINQEHRHCDMPVLLAQRLAPQTKDHAKLTLGLFELTLHFLDAMEKDLSGYMQIIK